MGLVAGLIDKDNLIQDYSAKPYQSSLRLKWPQSILFFSTKGQKRIPSEAGQRLANAGEDFFFPFGE